MSELQSGLEPKKSNYLCRPGERSTVNTTVNTARWLLHRAIQCIILPGVKLYWAARRRQQGLYSTRSCYKNCLFRTVAYGWPYSIKFFQETLQISGTICYLYISGQHVYSNTVVHQTCINGIIHQWSTCINTIVHHVAQTDLDILIMLYYYYYYHLFRTWSTISRIQSIKT